MTGVTLQTTVADGAARRVFVQLYVERSHVERRQRG